MSEAFSDHPMAQFLRKAAPKALAKALGSDQLRIKGSAGQSRWAEVPWIAVFDPTVSTGATNGQYVVYLFTANFQKVYLTLGQGTTMVRQEFGASADSELRRRAELLRARVPERLARFSDEAVDLKGKTLLARGYGPGIAFSIEYDLNALPDEEVLVDDLREAARLYLLATARGGIDSFDFAPADGQVGETIIERRRYRLHRKLERNATAASKVKAIHGYTCQCCGFNFETTYGQLGR